MEGIWHNTDGYGMTGPKLGYLTAEQNCRRERIRVARMLWQGWHRHCFLHEGRTQFNFPEMRIQGVMRRPYITYNILRLISTTLTDLLIGAEPILKLEGMQDLVNSLVKRSDLHSRLYGVCRSASWAAEGMMEVLRWDGQVYAQAIASDEMYPVGCRNPDGQYAQFTRYAEADSTEAKPRKLLLETTYQPGSISRQCWFLDGSNKGPDASLALWPVKRPDGSDLPDKEATGIEWSTIVWLGNEDDEGQVTSDFDGLIELQDELNSKQTQIARVIAKHADPKLAVAEFASGSLEGSVPSTHDLFFFRTKDEIPSYITWNAELSSAIADRDFTLAALCVAAEMTPELLGIKGGAAAESARKLRLSLTKPLARKDRKALAVAPFVRTVVDTAMMLEQAGKRVSVALSDSSVELRDGLPVDDLDQANTLSTMTGGKPVMSVKSAVQQRLPDAQAAAAEMEELKREQEANTPAILMQPEVDAETPPEGGTTNNVATDGHNVSGTRMATDKNGQGGEGGVNGD